MLKIAALAVLLSLVVAACGPRGRVRGADEADFVGTTGAGAEVYKKLVEEAVGKLLASGAVRVHPERRMTIAFAGIENAGIEELSDRRQFTYDTILNKIFKSGQYQVIDPGYISTALAAIGETIESLYLQGVKERFLDALRSRGQAPDYLLRAAYTTMTTSGNDEFQRDYKLTLTLIDAETGLWVASEEANIGKHYTK